jgi:hypothetical protein
MDATFLRIACSPRRQRSTSERVLSWLAGLKFPHNCALAIAILGRIGWKNALNNVTVHVDRADNAGASRSEEPGRYGVRGKDRDRMSA